MEDRKSREKKTDMLRSIGKQSGESVEMVEITFAYKRLHINVEST